MELTQTPAGWQAATLLPVANRRWHSIVTLASTPEQAKQALAEQIRKEIEKRCV